MKTVYDKIGDRYNCTRNADPFILSRLRNFLNPETGKTYLDIGCGSGNYTIALAGNEISFVGVDPSEKMLEVARGKSGLIKWLNGSSDNIPVENNCFDGAIATLTIHHWENLSKSFLEIKRVIKNNALVVIFTSTPDQMKGYWLNHYFPEMLRKSIRQMPSLENITYALSESKLRIIESEKYFVKEDLQDHFLYCGKHNPYLYFDQEIRNGISSFSAIANQQEVEEGLFNLKTDLEENRFINIKKVYENDKGDYLFLILR